MRIIPFQQLGVNSKGDGPRCSFQVITRTKAALWTRWDHGAPHRGRTVLLPLQDPKGIALGRVRLVMQ